MKSKGADERSAKEGVDFKGAKSNKAEPNDSANEAKKAIPKSILSLDALIRAATSAHPAFRYAIAAAGLAALAAISQRWGASPATLVFGSIVLLALMVLFLIFSVATKAEKKLRGPAVILIWTTTLLAVVVLVLLVASTFFNTPLRFRDILEHATSGSESQKENQNKTAEESLELIKLIAKINDEKSELQKRMENLAGATDGLVRGIDEELRIVRVTNLTTNAEVRQISERLESLVRDYDGLSKHRTPEIQEAHEIAISPKVGLEWDPNPGPDIAGYNVYIAEEPNKATSVLNAGTNLSIYIPNLKAGKTYYFYVTAYDNLGFESDFSKPVTYTIPASTKKD